MRHITLIALLFMCVPLSRVCAAEMYNVEYLCADWGPAMKLPIKADEKPQFSDTEEEIYFIKQLGSYTKILGKTEGHGVNIYLCKMKPDGSAKTEIKELWHNVTYPIDTQTQSTWMSVNAKTRKIVLSIIFAGSDIVGLWTMNLDGGELNRALPPTSINGHSQSFGNPSWTPDGHWIVFDESLRGVDRSWIAKCDKDGKNLTNLTDGPGDGQPRVSPDGTKVAYVRNGDAKTGGLYLMDIDGHNSHLLPNPDDKRSGKHSGLYPAWSPDGKKIFAVSAGVIDVVTGRKLGYGAPKIQNWTELNGKPANIVMPHWGILGFLCSGWGGGIQLSDEAMEKMWILASSDIKKERW